MAKTYNMDKFVAKPQNKKTQTVDPRAETSIHVVTWKRSMSDPMQIVPMQDAQFIAATVKALAIVED